MLVVIGLVLMLVGISLVLMLVVIGLRSDIGGNRLQF